MALPSGESLLISALLNVENAEEALGHGITPDHFRGYKDEYNWLINYPKTYEGQQPNRDIFKAQFPGFPMSDHADVRSACDLVLKSHGKHKITEAMNEAVDHLGMGEVHAAYEVLKAAEPRRTAPKPKRLLTDLTFFDTWAENRRFVEVPYRQLQLHTGGIKPGNLWYFAARPGNGKTAHLCNIATHAVLQGVRVKFYSLEMSEMEVRARFHAALATHFASKGYPDYKAINMQDIRDRRVDMDLYKEFIQFLAEDGVMEGTLDIHTPRDGIVSPATVATHADEYELNIVDYIGLMRSDDGTAAVSDWRVAAQISNRLKEIALSMDTGILAAAQINRDGDNGNEPPKVKNLAQSDALGQDGDVVITLRASSHNVASLMSLEKNRHGMSGIPFYTTFQPNEGIYRSITKEELEDLMLNAETDL